MDHDQNIEAVQGAVHADVGEKQLIAQLAAELSLRREQVTATIALIDDGNTIPFIARYRKEATGGISDDVLRTFDDRLTYLRNLHSRKLEVIKSITEQGKLTPELERAILGAAVLQTVEDLYRPYKPKRSTRASKAIERGLEPLADRIWAQAPEDANAALLSWAAEYVDVEKEVPDAEAALSGALDILAERISDDAGHREMTRTLTIAHGVVCSEAVDEKAQSVYEMYYEFSEPVSKMANHRILAVNRGEKEGVLKVKIEAPDETIVARLESEVIRVGEGTLETALRETTLDAYKRLIAPSISREVRGLLTERAEEEAIQIFGKNTKALLLVPPVRDTRVLAIDPGYRTGCKLAVLDETGKLLAYDTIYIHASKEQVAAAKAKLTRLIRAHGVTLISIGNGTASRETEQVVAELLASLNETVYYTIVSEAGASVYSASKLATEEYPDIDVSIRGAISIGRRLQDPLAELVKIDPKSIGVGQYQHDVNQKRLTEQLSGVVEDCVNSVGVDLNTATPSLLGYVSGISGTVAKNIVAHRDAQGRFQTREELLKVKRLGPKVYEQAVGFLRIPGGSYPLDNTAVHPEAYGPTEKLLSTLGYDLYALGKGALDDLPKRIETFSRLPGSERRARHYQDGLEALSERVSIGVPTLKDIIEEIQKPGRDPREGMPAPVFRSDVLKMDDLQVGMALTGTVRNVVDFGAFVDIGVKQDGLVHISQLSDRYVKHPMDVVSVGDVVKVEILSVDHDRGKIGLTMKHIKQS